MFGVVGGVGVGVGGIITSVMMQVFSRAGHLTRCISNPTKNFQ